MNKRNIEEINLSEIFGCLIDLISKRYEIFSHISSERVMVCLTTNRDGSKGATYGKLLPLCYANGSQSVMYQQKKYTMPIVKKNDVVLKYLLYLYMPKFFDLSVKSKLYVLFHELYHIGQNFDGDIRRMGRVKRTHGHSRKHYDSFFQKELKNFEDHIATTPYFNFLKMDSTFLKNNFQTINGFRLKMPKPIISD